MATVVAVRGSADIDLLSRALPGSALHEVGMIENVPTRLAQKAQLLILRSGATMDASRLAAWPALRHLIRAGSGMDGLDASALAARGVTMHRNPGPAAVAVAEWAQAALLSLARRMPYGQAAIAAGQHVKHECLAAPLSGSRLAIWGGGPVGQACARALGGHVGEVAFAAWPSLPGHLPRLCPEELAYWADVHLIALPATAVTRGMIDPGFLRRVRARRPLLVCVGRLATLDVAACLDALADGWLSGLALDPVEAGDVPLFRFGGPPLNLLATPHIGAQRMDVRAELDRWVASTARSLLLAEGVRR